MRAISACITSSRSLVRGASGERTSSCTSPFTDASGFFSSWATFAPTTCKRPACSAAAATRSSFSTSTADAAAWVAERGIRTLGVDYLSVQRFDDGPETHRILLDAGTVIVEGLNLTGVAAGRYELICLPLKLIGAEGAPARALLRPLE